MGLSVEQAQVKVAGTRLAESGPLLITHWGMSGPAILRLSAWGARILAENEYRFKVLVNWLPTLNEAALREQMHSLRLNSAAQKITSKSPFGLPQRLWEHLVAEAECKESWRWADLPSANQNKLIKNLLFNEFDVSGKTTFKEEFVTAGGIKLAEIDANTMQSRLHPGLYFAGEIMNVDGITGGYNFQHAWTSGYVAARAIAGFGHPDA
jgi:predicted Rossmann fold flavoprotein